MDSVQLAGPRSSSRRSRRKRRTSRAIGFRTAGPRTAPRAALEHARGRRVARHGALTRGGCGQPAPRIKRDRLAGWHAAASPPQTAREGCDDGRVGSAAPWAETTAGPRSVPRAGRDGEGENRRTGRRKRGAAVARGYPRDVYVGRAAGSTGARRSVARKAVVADELDRRDQLAVRPGAGRAAAGRPAEIAGERAGGRVPVGLRVAVSRD
jgi:hypothetical protein